VHEIAAQVQLLSNRATLIALNAVVSSGRPETAGDGGTAELKQLAREVRAVTERVASLSDDIGRAVDSANDKMRGVRDHVVSRLEQLPVPAPARAPAAPIAHWVERLREMVQDAARKGERLSESQERVSSEAQRLTRRLEEEARDVEGLLVRLSPPGETTAAGEPATGPTRRLRVVDASEHDRAEDTGPGEEMR
jgi:methyl-accepting chemotaxis protein